MEIINNLSNKNHREIIFNLFSKSNIIIIVSPFLTLNFDDFFNEINLMHNSTIELITTLQPNSIEQIRKIHSLISLINQPKLKKYSVKIKISINNKLHGKLYFFEGNNINKLIISSANFTKNGLVKNHEWGIKIENLEIINKVKKEIFESIEKRGISSTELEILKSEIENYKEENKIPKQKINLDLISIISKSKYLNSLPKETSFWVKPVGVSSNPIIKGKGYKDLELKLEFSKKPKIFIGDILILYGVGVKQFLSIYKVIKSPKKELEKTYDLEPWRKRWPWYVIGSNLTPNYGEKWWEYNLNAFNLVKEFKSKNKDIPITYIGGDTLGGLKFGNDKIRINRKFAEFVMTKIVDFNNK